MELQQEEMDSKALPAGDANKQLDVADMADPDGDAEPITAAEVEKIKIAGREFNSEAEAEAYVKQIESENLQVKAYNEGLLAGRAPGEIKPEAPKDPLEDLQINEEQFWQQPQVEIKKAISEVYRRAKEDAKREVDEIVTKRDNIKNLWENFWEANPDLRGKKDLIEYIYTKNPEIGNMEVSQAFQALAGRARDILDLSKPQKDLTSRSKPTPTGAQKSVTPKEKEPEYLDLAEQVRRMRKQRGL